MKQCILKLCSTPSWVCAIQEKQGYLQELEELIPQMETLIQDKEALDTQVHSTCKTHLCIMWQFKFSCTSLAGVP